MEGCIENVIEFLRDEKRATVTFSQLRFKTRIRKLAESHPEECQIVSENKDGTICAHVPVSWVKINPERNFSEEQRKASSERMKSINRNILNTDN